MTQTMCLFFCRHSGYKRTEVRSGGGEEAPRTLRSTPALQLLMENQSALVWQPAAASPTSGSCLRTC